MANFQEGNVSVNLSTACLSAHATYLSFHDMSATLSTSLVVAFLLLWGTLLEHQSVYRNNLFAGNRDSHGVGIDINT